MLNFRILLGGCVALGFVVGVRYLTSVYEVFDGDRQNSSSIEVPKAAATSATDVHGKISQPSLRSGATSEPPRSSTQFRPMQSAVELSPKGRIFDPGSDLDLDSLVELAKGGDSGAKLSVYRWWDYCQQHESTSRARSTMCSKVDVDVSAKRDMLLQAAQEKDWRSIDYLVAEYGAALYGKDAGQATEFRAEIIGILRSAANEGVAEAAIALSMIYYYGDGVQKDPVIAYAYLDRYLAGREHEADAIALLDRLRPLLRQGDWARVREMQKSMR